MKDEAHFDKTCTVRFERLLPGPLERVWEFISDPKLLPGWFGEARIEPRTCGAFKLMDGHVQGVVTQWKPGRKLAYTWNVFVPDNVDSPYPESYVTFELAARGENVALTLTHVPVLERFEKQNAMGWHTFLDMLGAGVRGEAVKPRGEYMKRNALIYGVDLANLER